MTWLIVKEVAELLKITESAVQKAVKQNKYEYRCVSGKGRGGIQYQIALESLPLEAQALYNSSEAPQMDYKAILKYTGKQRQVADFKALVVVEYRRSGLSVDEFISNFNTENPNDKITKHQLFRWQMKYKKNGDVADLIDTRGGYNRGQTKISDEAWDYFYCLYMTQQQRSIQRCWEFTKKAYPGIPSVSAFERKVKTIPKVAIVKYRGV